MLNSILARVVDTKYNVLVVDSEIRWPIFMPSYYWYHFTAIMPICQSVCHDCDPAKSSELIAMPFWMWTLAACCNAMSCAKVAELMEILFGLWTWVGPRKRVLDGCTLTPPGEYD